MAKKRKPQKPRTPSRRRAANKSRAGDDERVYAEALELVKLGRHDEAGNIYRNLEPRVTNTRLKALIQNDLAAIAALRGDVDIAKDGFQSALAIDVKCKIASDNESFLTEELSASSSITRKQQSSPPAAADLPIAAKIAVVSFLFNWPTGGGGNIHTVELAKFLAKAGYEIRHFYVQYEPWGIGNVSDEMPVLSQALEFTDADWNLKTIQDRLRHALRSFGPDWVLLTDSWNIKPHLAEAVSEFPYLLRMQALECLCPLNNLRLLMDSDGSVSQCTKHQLATPETCASCVMQRANQSGPLHQVERKLSDVGTTDYHRKLQQAFAGAEAVLVLNPLVEAMVSPYARSVHTVPWGMDAERFPWPLPEEERPAKTNATTLFMAGIASEPIKGFHVLKAACEVLWQRRQDFQLVVTGKPAGQIDAYTRFIGWIPQEDLPYYYRTSDICIVPTIAQDGLSRTSVEAMASGRPVIASRIGGLPYSVADGSTGLLIEPGSVDQLVGAIETLLDNRQLREQMGVAGRRRFEQEFTWETVIERHYRPLLTPKRSSEFSNA